MTTRQLTQLVIISSLWGSSYIFMKVISPVFGPVLVSSLRLLLASLFLLIYMLVSRKKISFKGNILFFIFVGVVNSAIPFVLYAFAALHIDASLSGTLNSSSPMFGALFGFIILKNRFDTRQILGLIVGFLGVIIVSSTSFGTGTVEAVISVFACLLASACYGLAGTYVKKRNKDVDATTLSLGTLFFAGLFLLPFSFFYKISLDIQVSHILYLLFFAIMCTSVPYILYYKLLREVGAVKALTVTYLIPLFTVLWSYIFLAERAGWNVFVGLVIILTGVGLLSKRNDLLNREKR